MAYKKTGTCNMCGECCGYPRSTDGGQNNAWPPNILINIQNLSPKAVKELYPIVDFLKASVKHNKINGTIKVGDKDIHWIFVEGYGICEDLPPYGDTSKFNKSCPFLSKKLANGEVPCLIYGSKETNTWHKSCKPVPPELFETEEQLNKWKKNCPSCSYIFVEV